MKDVTTKGIALINALIVVAAISSIAIALLMRVEHATQRVALSQHAAQADLYLDATELLVSMLLDQLDLDVIHFGQDWARERMDEPIDVGNTGWLIQDLQGRFNVNWMIGDDDEAVRARGAFNRLLQREGFSNDQIKLIMESFLPVGEGRKTLSGTGDGWYTTRHLALPLQNVRELGLITGIDEADIVRLEQVAAALPRETALNVNTVVPSVLVALFPDVDISVPTALEKRQADDPFETTGRFLEWIRDFTQGHDVDISFVPRMSTGSHWFKAEISAELGVVSRNRTLVLHRPMSNSRTTVMFSIAEVLRQRKE